MDDPSLSVDDLVPALEGLRRLNRWTSPHAAAWRFLRAGRPPEDRPLRVLDIATGSGDFPRTVARLAERDGIPVDITAIDRNPNVIEEARRLTSPDLPIRFLEGDATDLRVDLPTFDVVSVHLFLHHLTDEEAGALLGRLTSARRGIVCDLVRGFVPYASTRLVTRFASRSWVVATDGPLSVRAGFRRAELLRLARDAGLPSMRLRRRFPFRWMLTWGDES